MTRDWDLIRKILEVLESRDSTHGMLTPEAVPDYPANVVSYHYYLLDQAGLIKARCLNAMNTEMICMALSLTWQGHEFLDQIRSDTVWNQVKETAKSKGLEVTMEVAKSIASAATKTLLGLPS